MRKEPGNPMNYALLTNLGSIQRRQGKLEEALLSYTAALSGRPNNPTILENRASLYSEMGETEKALNDYNALLIEEPTNEEALLLPWIDLHTKEELYLGRTGFRQDHGDQREIGTCPPGTCHPRKDAWQL